MNELLEKLGKLRTAMKSYVNRDDLTDDEAAKLDELNKEAAKLEARIAAEEQLAKGEVEEKARIEREKQAYADEAVKAERARNRRIPGAGDAPYQSQYSDTARYDNLDAVELSLLIELQKSFGNKGVKYVDGSDIEVTTGALKAMALRVGEFKPESLPGEKPDEARKSMDYVKNAFKAATRIEPTSEGVSDAIKRDAIKAATDPMYTGGSGIGSDWVGTAYSTELWRVIRANTPVVSNVPSDVIPDGYSSKTWPLESTDMTWYKVAEATSSDSTLKVPAATVTASQIATLSKNIPVAKLGARGLYTQELDEDSLIRFASQLKTQLEISGREVLESLFIDGDVETSANKNINAIDTTPGATDYYLMFDGFRKLALVTNTANSRSAGGSLVVEDFLDTLKLMGTAGIAGSDPTKCAFIVDANVYYAMAKLSELKTKDTYSAATIENGLVKSVWNVPVMASWQMHKASAKRMANNAGKIDADTDSNNTLGAIVAVRWDQWKQAYKRRMTMEVTRIANADSWEIVALARLGLAYRDNEASAETYNVGI